MAFSDLIAGLDATCLTAFGEISATIHYATAQPDATLPAISCNPALEEDYVPGSAQGVAVLILFVHLTSAESVTVPLPLEGDTASVNGVDYDIFRVGADREGGRKLYLRRRSQPWNQ